jgi:hypothetical protein
MGEERRRPAEGEEIVEYTCPECGYWIKYHLFSAVKREWFPKSWAEAMASFRRYRSV